MCVCFHPCICARTFLSIFESGALDFLERPTVTFVCLKESAVLGSALEAPTPVRFVFVLVGPGSADLDYHETGRAMAALLADKVSIVCLFPKCDETMN